jgi:predicted branched-subunit amino acid permease
MAGISETGEITNPGQTNWFLAGMRAAVSVPGLILSSAFVGFAGLAREAGVSLAETMFMVFFVWALPAKVVLVGSIISGASLPAAAFAVALSSVRLMPMVVALVPEMRTKDTRPWVLYLLSHCIAVTAWVIALERFRHVPLDKRTTFFGGLGFTLVSFNAVLAGVVHQLATGFPPVVMAALFFLTPLYFLTSLWGSAREHASLVAMVLGLVLGPIFHLVIPDYDLLAAGLTGGLAAYGWHVWQRRRGA